MAKKPETIHPDLLDELLAGRGPKTVFSSEVLLGDLKKALFTRALHRQRGKGVDTVRLGECQGGKTQCRGQHELSSQEFKNLRS
jgi:hypothetical protein